MSTVAYKLMSTARDAAPKGKSKTEAPPGTTAWADTLVALVPAEALAFYTSIVVVTTQHKHVDVPGDGTTDKKEVLQITDLTGLRVAYALAVALCLILYLAPRARKTARQTKLDRMRFLVPAVAFIGWTLLQEPSGFEVWGIEASDATRLAIAGFVAVAAGALAKRSAEEADQRGPG